MAARRGEVALAALLEPSVFPTFFCPSTPVRKNSVSSAVLFPAHSSGRHVPSFPLPPYLTSRKEYWGGGSVFLATASLDWKHFKPQGAERFEDGTLAFLSIMGLQQG